MSAAVTKHRLEYLQAVSGSARMYAKHVRASILRAQKSRPRNRRHLALEEHATHLAEQAEKLDRLLRASHALPPAHVAAPVATVPDTAPAIEPEEDGPEEYADEMGELYKAALSRGQP